MKIIETERLTMREYTEDDAGFIYELLNSPGWLKHIGSRGISGLKEAGMYIKTMMMPSYAENGFGMYMMELKEDGTPIGMCGLIKREALDDIDIGFAVLPSYEGKGYTSEAAVKIMEHAQELGLKKIVAMTVTYNLGSIRVLEKIGMKYEKMINLPNDPEELMLFVKEF